MSVRCRTALPDGPAGRPCRAALPGRMRAPQRADMHSFAPVDENGPPVVVGIDGTANDLKVVDAAAGEAARRGLPLEIVHAWTGGHPEISYRRNVPSEAEMSRHLLELAALRASHVYPALPVRTDLSDDGPAEALLRASAQAYLLVVRHRNDAAAGNGWGSTAACLAHHSACPLLVYRGPSPGQGPVVLATSGRRTATFDCAFEAASYHGCRLLAVHAREQPESGDGDVLEQARSRWPGVTVERLHISESDVPYTAERASRRGRLLVAGRGHKGWFVEQLYSATSVSTGGRLLCPVLLVPPGRRFRTY
jgi:nucleotide-binding universal stress UspA family protein